AFRRAREAMWAPKIAFRRARDEVFGSEDRLPARPGRGVRIRRSPSRAPGTRCSDPKIAFRRAREAMWAPKIAFRRTRDEVFGSEDRLPARPGRGVRIRRSPSRAPG